MTDGYDIVRRCLENAQDELRHACHTWSESLPQCEVVNKAHAALQLLCEIERDVETLASANGGERTNQPTRQSA